MGIVKKLVLITLILALVSSTGCASLESAGKVDELVGQLEDQIDELEVQIDELEKQIEELESSQEEPAQSEDPQEEILGLSVEVEPDLLIAEPDSELHWKITIINTGNVGVYIEKTYIRYYADGKVVNSSSYDPEPLGLKDNYLEAGAQVQSNAGTGSTGRPGSHEEFHVQYEVIGKTADGRSVNGFSDEVEWIFRS